MLDSEQLAHVNEVRRWAQAHWQEPCFLMERTSATPATVVWLCNAVRSLQRELENA